MPTERSLDDAVLLRLIVENLPDMVFVKDSDELRFVRFNRAGEDLLGWKREELIGKNDYDFFPKAEADFFTAKDRDVLAAGRLVDIPEEPIHTARHGLRWLHTKKIPIADPEGRPQFLLGISRDVTELREARVALEDRERRLRLLLERFPGIVWTADEQLRFVTVDGARAAAVGLSGPDVSGSPVATRMRRGKGERSVEELHREALAGRTVTFEFTAGALEFDARLEPMPTGGVVRMMGVALDVTEQREVQRQRTQRVESLGVLAGGIAHDFNNLLVGILGNASLALTRLPPESPARDDVKRIETAAERAADLTRQMLAYSGRARFHIEPVDLSAMVLEMGELLRSSIPKHVTIHFDLHAAPPAVEADLAQMRQVVMNLITNAADATGPDGGAVTIRTVTHEIEHPAADETGEVVPAGRYVMLEVHDDGCGMDEDVRRRMFDPFFSTKDRGHGLGLAATLGIVRAHRGSIRVVSAPGGGTTVHVLLPALAQPVAGRIARPATPAVETPPARGVVLVVDDEDGVREFIRSALEFDGFEVFAAKDGTEGVAVFREHADRIDLVVLDMTMPGLSGERTFEELRKVRPDVRVVLSSGYNEDEAIARFAWRGLAGFLQKPYRHRDLLEAVVRHMRRGGGA